MSTKKVVLITGGTSGIGKELAKCFAINGYAIIIVAKDQKNIDQTSEEFRKQYGIEIGSILVDLSQSDAASKVYAALGGRRIDVLVNNAGYGMAGLFAENDIEKMLGMMRINMETLTHLTRLVLPDMIDRRSGKILNVASTAAFQPGPMMAVYYATKAYVVSFSEAIRYELQGTGVTVTTLCPGPMTTHFAKRAHATSSRLFRKNTMKPDEVARQAYVALIDQDAMIVPGFRNKLGRLLVKFTPRNVVLRIINDFNKPR